MGGMGSGSWKRYGSKSTVEESLTLDVNRLKWRIHGNARGTLSWTWTDGDKSSLDYDVICDDAGLLMTLRYRDLDGEDVRLPIRFDSTPMTFGSERLWFTCPLRVDGRACKRRVTKLHLPPGARYFGCRHCHDLTYRSCQTAHRNEREVRMSENLGEWIAKLNRRMGLN